MGAEELPLAAVTQLSGEGWRPGAQISFQVYFCPLAKRAAAVPLTASALPPRGANQSGELMAACGGILPLEASATAAPRSARPQPKCSVHSRSGVAQVALGGVPLW